MVGTFSYQPTPIPSTTSWSVHFYLYLPRFLLPRHGRYIFISTYLDTFYHIMVGTFSSLPTLIPSTKSWSVHFHLYLPWYLLPSHGRYIFISTYLDTFYQVIIGTFHLYLPRYILPSHGRYIFISTYLDTFYQVIVGTFVPQPTSIPSSKLWSVKIHINPDSFHQTIAGKYIELNVMVVLIFLYK